MARNKQGVNVMTRNSVIKGNRAVIRPFIDGKEYDHFVTKTFELNESVETTSLPRLNGNPIIVPGDPTYEGSFTDYYGSPLFLKEVSSKFVSTGVYPQIDFMVDLIDTGSDRGTATYEVKDVIITGMPVINIDVESVAVEGSYNITAGSYNIVDGFDYLKGERR